MPIGVAFNADVKASCGAVIKPFVDVSIVPAIGHRKVKNSFGLADGSATDKLETRIANNALFQGKVGKRLQEPQLQSELWCRYG